MPNVVPFLAGVLGIGAVTTAAGVAGAAVAGFLTTTVVGRLLSTVALTALSRAVQSKPKQKPVGIRTSTTTTGGINPASFVLGQYATAGNAVGPDMTHGTSGGTPNAYFTRVIDLGDIAGQQLAGLFLDGSPVTIGTVAHPDYGFPLTSTGVATGGITGAWIKYYDGTQTAADPMLLAKYGSDPDFPWTSDMIGSGIPYAILTFLYNRKIFSTVPEALFVVDGIPLYDPRLDSSVGGSGTQRWADQTTWQTTTNPAVQIYNIMRGISFADGSVWGLGTTASALPVTEWFSAMNAADTTITLADTTTEAAYRSGYEVRVSDQPVAVLDELLKACAGQMAEVGGVWNIRVGGPGLPVLFITDDDIIVTSPQDLAPFPGLSKIFNGVQASYPEPVSGWAPKDAPPRFNLTYETADQGRRLVADLSLPASPYRNQVQRLMRAYIEEERRFLRHTFTLPPEAAVLSPMDVISYTSARNGYASKNFEVAAVEEDPKTMLQRVSLREVDSSDYVWSSSYELPTSTSVTVRTPPVAQVPSGFLVSPTSMFDALGVSRRAAIKLTWSGVNLEGIFGIAYEAKLKTSGVIVDRNTITDVDSGEALISAGIIPAQTYQVRAKFVSNRPQNWTAWIDVTTDSTLITTPDIEAESITTEKIASTIQSTNFVAGSAGWKIEKTGAAEFNSLVVRSDMIIDGVTAISALMYDGNPPAFWYNLTDADTSASPKYIENLLNYSFQKNINPVTPAGVLKVDNPVGVTLSGLLMNNDINDGKITFVVKRDYIFGGPLTSVIFLDTKVDGKKSGETQSLQHFSLSTYIDPDSLNGFSLQLYAYLPDTTNYPSISMGIRDFALKFTQFRSRGTT